MVTEPRDVRRSRDTRNGHGVAGRFRPLGTSDDGPDPSPPEFATAPWGYRRAEVDAWASWVAGLVAHGRNETVRADSAEATLRAALDRLERLEQGPPTPSGDARDLPRRPTGGRPADGASRARAAPRPVPHTTASITRAVGPDTTAGTGEAAPPTTTSDTSDTQRGMTPGAAPGPVADGSAPGPALPNPSGPEARDETGGGAGEGGPGPEDTGTPSGPHQEVRDDDAVRLQIVEATLCEVMRLLHRLVGPEASTRTRAPSTADS